MFDFANLFLGSDLPANFSDMYFYANNPINEYPSLVGYEVFEFNNDLLERFYTLSQNVTLLEVNPTLQWYRTLYQYDVARQPPSVTKGASESSNFWWSGDVAAANVEYYVDLLTNGTANYANTNNDDMGRTLALFFGALRKKLDFSRIAMVKSNSNYDRPPPGYSAYYNRYVIEEIIAEAEPDYTDYSNMYNAWTVLAVLVDDILENWESSYLAGISASNYIGDPFARLGGIPNFGKST
ncbi:hypothetical protein N7513_002735 [Penicillium frequentans]|nr:hypothetical protein N7513_002735 [Penicillium glabrum]